MMAWTLSANLKTERLVVQLLRTAGVKGARAYYAPYQEGMPFIISDQERGIAAGTDSGAALLAAVGLPFFIGRDSPIPHINRVHLVVGQSLGGYNAS